MLDQTFKSILKNYILEQEQTMSKGPFTPSTMTIKITILGHRETISLESLSELFFPADDTNIDSQSESILL